MRKLICFYIIFFLLCIFSAITGSLAVYTKMNSVQTIGMIVSADTTEDTHCYRIQYTVNNDTIVSEYETDSEFTCDEVIITYDKSKPEAIFNVIPGC